jgi:hypothetical protein
MIIEVPRKSRTHIIEVEGAAVRKWIVRIPDGRESHMSYQMKRPYTVYSDKKGDFIKLNCDEKVHKHYL